MASLNMLSNVAVLAGVIALQSGAETFRVEETIEKIALSQGAQKVNSYVTPTGIFLYLEDSEGNNYTRLERVKNIGIDLHKVILVNDISRRMVEKRLSLNEAAFLLAEIREVGKLYSSWLYLLAGSLAGASFAFLFGGKLPEVVFAFVAGLFIQGLGEQRFFRVNRFFVSFFGGAIAAVIALIGSFFVANVNIDKIIIGAIMTLVPGVAITNTIRDVLHQDYLSGAARGLEAFLIALSIAAGVTLVIGMWLLYGGGIKWS